MAAGGSRQDRVRDSGERVPRGYTGDVADIALIVLVIAFFVLAGAMAAGCDWITGGRTGDEEQR